MTIVDLLDNAIREWNVLEHPFYRRWSAGVLQRSELAAYASQYRYAVKALAAAASATGNSEHAAEEASHIELWEQFAHACDARFCVPTNGTTACAASWRAGDDVLEHLAVLYAIESTQPEIARVKLEGLISHYDFVKGPGTEYFAVHAERDVEHAELARLALEAGAGPADCTRLVRRAVAAARGNWRLLDDIPS